ncbi:MAG: hypothetical protein ACE5J5_01110 [Candidatus Hydrothermarchaeales archaeon]
MADLNHPSRLKKGTELTKKEIIDLPVAQMDYTTLPEPNGQAIKIHNFAASLGELRKKKANKRPDNS